MTAQAIIPVPFRDTSLTLIDREGEPFAAMRPIVEGMGLDWPTQFTKLKGTRFASTVGEIPTVAEDGKQRSMTCLPLRKLPGWLMSIYPSKVRPEIRETVIAFQNECDDVLWAHWQARTTPPPVVLPSLTEAEVHDMLRTRLRMARMILTVDDDDRMHLQGLAHDAMVIRVTDHASVTAFIRHHLPADMIPVVMEVLAARLRPRRVVLGQ